MPQNDDATPCIIDPLAKLNDLDDLKPKRQQAVYIFQRDLRRPIDHYLPIEKIIVSKTLHTAIKDGLTVQGITKDYVYGQTEPLLSNP